MVGKHGAFNKWSLILEDKMSVWVHASSPSHVQLFATSWSVAHQAPLFLGFSRQQYWSVLPSPSPGIFLTQWSNPGLLHRQQGDSLPSALLGKPKVSAYCIPKEWSLLNPANFCPVYLMQMFPFINTFSNWGQHVHFHIVEKSLELSFVVSKK